MSNGGTVITRYVLQDLLDKLDEVLSPERSHDNADRSKARNAAPGHDHQEYRR